MDKELRRSRMDWSSKVSGWTTYSKVLELKLYKTKVGTFTLTMMFLGTALVGRS
jgi:hypothetical protein